MFVSSRFTIDPLEPRRLLSSASGTVFHDDNHNGVMDNVEVGIGGRIVYLDINNNIAHDPGEPWDESSSTGDYYLNATGAPTAPLRQIVPAGWVGNTTPYTIAANQSRFDLNFASYVSGSSIPTGRITVNAYNDANGDGLWNPGESSYPGQKIWLDLNNDGSSYAEPFVTTDSLGNAAFNVVRPGTYSLQIGRASCRERV